jgi:hypothetical protein
MRSDFARADGRWRPSTPSNSRFSAICSSVHSYRFFYPVPVFGDGRKGFRHFNEGRLHRLHSKVLDIVAAIILDCCYGVRKRVSSLGKCLTRVANCVAEVVMGLSGQQHLKPQQRLSAFLNIEMPNRCWSFVETERRSQTSNERLGHLITAPLHGIAKYFALSLARLGELTMLVDQEEEGRDRCDRAHPTANRREPFTDTALLVFSAWRLHKVQERNCHRGHHGSADRNNKCKRSPPHFFPLSRHWRATAYCNWFCCLRQSPLATQFGGGMPR